MDSTSIGNNKTKISVLFWFITCLLGSFVASEINRFSFNQQVGFHISFIDGILIAGILTLVSLVASSPLFFVFIYFINAKNGRKPLILLTSLFLVVCCLTVFYWSRSILDTFLLLFPYLLLTILFAIILVKKNHFKP